MSIRNSLTPTQRYKKLLSCYHSLYRLFNSTYKIRDLVGRLAKLICQILDSESCQISLLDSSKKFSVLSCKVTQRKIQTIEKKSKIINRIEKKIIQSSSCLMEKRLLGVPLIAEDIIGIIVLQRLRKNRPFGPFEEELLMNIASTAISGIKNIQLYQEQQRIIEGVIKSLVSLLDMRVPSEYAHSPYFVDLGCAIGEQLNLNESELQSLKYASLLHDAGKIDIPLGILTKSSKLTAEEYKIIRQHPEKSAEILKSLQILKPAIPIVLHHHERYDGRGYPSGLKKGQIPLSARIMAVADAFEAMVYGRPYRERLDVGSAIREIVKKSNSQFDPKVVQAFLIAVKSPRLRKYLKRCKG